MSLVDPPQSVSWQDFKAHLLDRVHHWRLHRLPGRWNVLRDLEDLQRLLETVPLEARPPLGSFPKIALATIDDGWGNGLEVIAAAAQAVGAQTVRLGLLCTPEEILEACRRDPPDILGLTVLRADAEPLVAAIVQGLPQGVIVAAGGPVFQWDPDFARRTGIHKVFDDVASFLQWLSSLLP
ncbi:MAG: cobalamin-dependent protein [Desulfosoma sp.]